MPEYTKEEALAFIEAMRLAIQGKVGFKWHVERLSRLAEFIESLAAENDALRRGKNSDDSAAWAPPVSDEPQTGRFEMAEESTARSIDEYIAGFPAETQRVLEQLRELVREVAPDATETISYAMPTFDLDGHHLVHFAAWTRHIGWYPVPSGSVEWAEELGPYETSKGTARFPLDQPMPVDLIRRLVEYRVAQVAGESRE